MAVLRYLSHPQVTVDPDVPVPRWSLSPEGRRRVEIMAEEQPWVATLGRVVSSGETKARQTARLLARRLGPDVEVEVRPETGEIDRSATGFVSPGEHEELADALFAQPEVSARGWERAVDAQARMVAALADLLDPATPADIAVVGHGGVGTLWWCHLAGLAIDRRHDQPGQGHHWALDLTTGRPIHPWRPIDRIDLAGQPSRPGGPGRSG